MLPSAAMSRPVWLFSMDTEQFHAPPMTTGALLAHYAARGRRAAETDVELVHFLTADDFETWLREQWPGRVLARAEAALDAGRQPVFGFSCYTWNVAEFAAIARRVKATLPAALVVAGGPHVQRAEDFLYEDGFDVIVLGEGEETFTELLDCTARDQWKSVAGLAFVDESGAVHETPARRRSQQLDEFPTALDHIQLRDAAGRPLYRQVAYETSRGCPYRCAFCEWGTGAIGTKMYQFSLQRIGDDLERLVRGGVEDIWLCDSNFGALREDLAKTELVIELRERHGLPRSFATSWSKNHNQRVQQMVRLLHANGLLSHYHLALQTLTPRALELSHRTNMRANDYEPIVKSLAEDGIPVAAELIWGLPGDTLHEFEANLDHLLTIFPNINIFGYTLLPGTEFFERRDEYRLQTIPVAGYGKAKGEYVIGCHTFTRDQGEEGYFLITAYIILSRGQIMPLTARHLAFSHRLPVAALLRRVLRDLLDEFAADAPDLVGPDRMTVYENRAALFQLFVANSTRAYDVVMSTVEAWLDEHDAGAELAAVRRVLQVDEALCPSVGAKHVRSRYLDFDAAAVEASLMRMEPAEDAALAAAETREIQVDVPGGVGHIMLDPDGGAWVRGRLRRVPAPAALPRRPL
jgi:hypothetical protein